MIKIKYDNIIWIKRESKNLLIFIGVSFKILFICMIIDRPPNEIYVNDKKAFKVIDKFNVLRVLRPLVISKKPTSVLYLSGIKIVKRLKKIIVPKIIVRVFILLDIALGIKEEIFILLLGGILLVGILVNSKIIILGI